MQFLNDIFGKKEGALNVIKNPFEFQNIEEIHIHCTKGILSGKFGSRAIVHFSNGNTEGRQKFESDSLIDVFMKVYNFCNELNNR